MSNLRWASFRNNYIKDISKLSNFKLLEELSLEKNNIEAIDCLSQIPVLKKLDVSSNQISNIDNVELSSIMFLSLEKNKIKSLRAFAKMTTLFELYVGDNLVSHLFTTFPLKELPRLIILDLTGNPVCKLLNFRLFTVFHLNRLKILNGSGVTLKDQNQAKEIYLGKLTIELLGEKVGHFNFKNIAELDLRNCKIKEIDCLSGSDFRSLRKLNFDNNLLVNIDCFASLSGLRHLSVNSNKLERLLSYDGSLNDFKPQKSFLPNLEELYLGHNNISKISDLGLHRLSQLKVLYLQGNCIMKVDGLEQMTNLLELVLDKNQIKAIDNVSFLSLINLKELHIKENRLKSLANFDCLPSLKILFLTGNRIHEMSEIEVCT
jgi:Leucine-rich repeat (LRR) protein